MAFGFVQGPISGPPTSVSLTGTVAGNFLLAFVNDDGGATPRPEPTGMTVNAGAGTQLTWTKILAPEGSFPVFGSYYKHTWFVSSAIPAGIAGNMTVQVVPSGNAAKQTILEIFCADTEVHIDGTGTSNQIGTSNPPVASVDTAEANGAIFSAITSSHAHPGIGAGYTGIAIPNSTSFQEGEYDLDHGAAGTISVPYTGSVNTSLISAFSLQEGAAITTEPVADDDTGTITVDETYLLFKGDLTAIDAGGVSLTEEHSLLKDISSEDELSLSILQGVFLPLEKESSDTLNVSGIDSSSPDVTGWDSPALCSVATDWTKESNCG